MAITKIEIEIKKEFAEKLGLKDGDLIEQTTENGGIVIRRL